MTLTWRLRAAEKRLRPPQRKLPLFVIVLDEGAALPEGLDDDKSRLIIRVVPTFLPTFNRAEGGRIVCPDTGREPENMTEAELAARIEELEKRKTELQG
jgi:hypothetical protein